MLGRSYCNYCNSIVERERKDLGRDHVFCNRDCFQKHRKENHINKNKTVIHKAYFVKLNCCVCQKEYSINREKTYRPFIQACSKECKEKYYENTFSTIKGCDNCGKPLKRNKGNPNKKRFCNIECTNSYKEKTFRLKTSCGFCGTEIIKYNRIIEKYKTRVFCNHSCRMKHMMANDELKINKVSKPEKYIQAKLLEKYPNIKFCFNKNDVIKSELDIYIPEFKLAFELNGTFHYEPIFGQDTLLKTQNNDKRKFQACLEQGIEFCTIDTSKITYVKPNKMEPYLKIITDIIDSKINQRDLTV